VLASGLLQLRFPLWLKPLVAVVYNLIFLNNFLLETRL